MKTKRPTKAERPAGGWRALEIAKELHELKRLRRENESLKELLRQALALIEPEHA